jgi:PAS domain S-box-containing protein
MPMYTFYCCKPDGSATTFEAHALKGDEAARERAGLLVRQHASCAYVAIFEADREVAQARRPAAREAVAGGPVSIASTRVDPASLARVLRGAAAQRPAVALIATTLQGTVVYWDAAAARLYGWREEEAIGKDVVGLTPALQSRGQAQEIMTRLQAGEAWSGEITLRTRDGTPFSAFVADIPIGVHGDHGLIVGASAPLRNRKAVEAREGALIGDLRRAFGG